MAITIELFHNLKKTIEKLQLLYGISFCGLGNKKWFTGVFLGTLRKAYFQKP